MLSRKFLKANAGFSDPRAGKTNVIGARSSASVTFGSAILGPDGALSGVTATSTANTGRIAWGPTTLTAGQTYTISMYVKIPADYAIRFYIGTGTTGETSAVMVLGTYADWTLVEVQYTAVITSSDRYMWIGASNTFTQDESISIALPMFYLGPKVT